MASYMIEVRHEPDEWACTRALELFYKAGLHFFSKANWGCGDGVHKAWLLLEAHSAEEARLSVPPIYRSFATITEVSRFGSDMMDQLLRLHSEEA